MQAWCGTPLRQRRVSPATVPHTCTPNSFPPEHSIDSRYGASQYDVQRVALRVLPAFVQVSMEQIASANCRRHSLTVDLPSKSHSSSTNLCTASYLLAFGRPAVG